MKIWIENKEQREKNMMSDKGERIDVKGKVGIHGSLRWNASLVHQDRRACFLGRLIGLYASGTGMKTEKELTAFCETFRDPRKRRFFVTTLNCWLENAPTRNWSRQYKTIYIAYPGIKGIVLAEEPFDIEALKYCANWEFERLTARDSILESFRRLWPRVTEGSVFYDLDLPPERFQKWRQMDSLMGLDVERCLNEGWNAVIDNPYFVERPNFGDNIEAWNAWIAEPGRVECRKEFIKAWRTEEARLLAMSPKDRDKEYEEQGV